MKNTVLFDLDGTLILLGQEAFINTYFGKLAKVFIKLGLDAQLAVKAVWAGTKAMMENDGNKLNRDRFWDTFSAVMELDDEKRREVEAQCDAFYSGEFDTVKEIAEPTDIPKRLISMLRERGYTVVLATNPFFPECAVTTRLRWIGLEPEDFAYVTHYGNSTYCKPNPGYFKELLGKIGKEPEECIMAGNNINEDMSAAALGIETFLVTNCLENETGADISVYRNGTLEELEKYLTELGYVYQSR